MSTVTFFDKTGTRGGVGHHIERARRVLEARAKDWMPAQAGICMYPQRIGDKNIVFLTNPRR